MHSDLAVVTREQLERALRIYLVADAAFAGPSVVEGTRSALAGGVTMVQLRAKAISNRECLALATVMRQLCHDQGVPFLVNDRVDVAIAVGADGVHLGVNDLPIDVVRLLVGPNAIIGFSPETDDEAREAARLGANYLGVGPVFGTATKTDAGPPIGAEAIGRRSMLSGLPAIGIGGITSHNAAVVIEAGGAGVAVVSAILGQPDPTAAARRLALVVSQAIAHHHA